LHRGEKLWVREARADVDVALALVERERIEVDGPGICLSLAAT
jgi:hypothetical protein